MSYVPKKGKTVVLMSSMHHDDKIDKSTGELMKPDIISFYNSTKDGVDCLDERIAFYNVARNTRRWTMAVFYALLNIAGFNSYIVCRSNNSDSPHVKNRRSFLKKLMFDLTEDQIKGRAAKRISGMKEVPQPECSENKRGRCHVVKTERPVTRVANAKNTCVWNTLHFCVSTAKMKCECAEGCSKIKDYIWTVFLNICIII